MTEFVYRPYKRVYVRDVIRLNLDDFIGMMTSMESMNAYWADGVMFASFAMTESEELAKKEMQDEMYLDRIMFTKYDNYSKTAKSANNLEIGILNVQNSPIYRQLVAWLRSQTAWNE